MGKAVYTDRAIRDPFSGGEIKLVISEKGKGHYQIATVFEVIKVANRAKVGPLWTGKNGGYGVWRRGPSQDKAEEHHIDEAAIHEKSDEYIKKIREQSDGAPRELKIMDIVLAQHPDKSWALAIIIEKHYEHDVIKSEEDDERVTDKVLECIRVEALQRQSRDGTQGPFRFNVQPTELKHMTITSPCLLNRDGVAIYAKMSEEHQDGLGAKGKVPAERSELQLGNDAVDVSPEPLKKKPVSTEKKETAKKARSRQAVEPRRDVKASAKRKHKAAKMTSKDSSDSTIQSGGGDSVGSVEAAESERPTKRAKSNSGMQVTSAATELNSTLTASQRSDTPSGSIEATAASQNAVATELAPPVETETLNIGEILSFMEAHLADTEAYSRQPLLSRLKDLQDWSEVAASLGLVSSAQGSTNDKLALKFEKLRSKLAYRIEDEAKLKNIRGIKIPNTWLIRYHLADRVNFMKQSTTFRKEQLDFWVKEFAGWDEDMKVDLALRLLAHNENLKDDEEATSRVAWPPELIEDVPLRLQIKIQTRFKHGTANFPISIDDKDDGRAQVPLVEAPWRYKTQWEKAVEQHKAGK